ncbi:MAG TPA: hypothetical protein VMF30_07335 [Pirellulales bacterium]|nr:hypothetical protein [Pirellulales bacterium]
MILALKDAARLTHRSTPSRTDISREMAHIRNVWSDAERKRRAEMSLLLQLRLLAKCEAAADEA